MKTNNPPGIRLLQRGTLSEPVQADTFNEVRGSLDNDRDGTAHTPDEWHGNQRALYSVNAESARRRIVAPAGAVHGLGMQGGQAP